MNMRGGTTILRILKIPKYYLYWQKGYHTIIYGDINPEKDDNVNDNFFFQIISLVLLSKLIE